MDRSDHAVEPGHHRVEHRAQPQFQLLRGENRHVRFTVDSGGVRARAVLVAVLVGGADLLVLRDRGGRHAQQADRQDHP